MFLQLHLNNVAATVIFKLLPEIQVYVDYYNSYSQFLSVYFLMTSEIRNSGCSAVFMREIRNPGDEVDSYALTGTLAIALCRFVVCHF